MAESQYQFSILGWRGWTLGRQARAALMFIRARLCRGRNSRTCEKHTSIHTIFVHQRGAVKCCVRAVELRIYEVTIVKLVNLVKPVKLMKIVSLVYLIWQEILDWYNWLRQNGLTISDWLAIWLAGRRNVHPKVTYDFWLVSGAIESNSLMNMSPFQILLYMECWRMVSKPCHPSPSQLSSPQRQPAMSKLYFLFGIFIRSCHLHIPVHTGAQWPRDG